MNFSDMERKRKDKDYRKSAKFITAPKKPKLVKVVDEGTKAQILEDIEKAYRFVERREVNGGVENNQISGQKSRKLSEFCEIR